MCWKHQQNSEMIEEVIEECLALNNAHYLARHNQIANQFIQGCWEFSTDSCLKGLFSHFFSSLFKGLKLGKKKHKLLEIM